jgi:hypothetical protein
MSESQDWVEFGVTRDIHKKEKVVRKKHRDSVLKGSPESVAMHKAFEKAVKDEYTMLDMFNDYTLSRDEYGYYTNLSVRMEWPHFLDGWVAAKKFFKPTRFKKEK